MATAQKTEAKLNFTAPVDALLEAATKIMSVVPAKSPKPVLTNIKFETIDGKLELSGADVGAGIYYAIPAATVTAEGTGLIGGTTLLETLKEFRGGDATIVFNPRGGCRFKAPGGDFKIVGDDPRDYPHIVRFEHHPGINIPGTDLVDMVKKSAFAIAEEESRLATSGVLFEHKAGRFRLVATDNKRMAINQRSIEAGGADFSVTVPPAFLKALLKVVSKDVAGNQATIGVDSNRIFFRLSTATVYSSVLDGKFPPYEEALKIVLAQTIDCNVATLLATIRRTCLVDKDTCAFNFTKGAVGLKASSSTVGTGSVDMPISYEGPDVRVGLNPVFVREGLEAMTSRRCRFMFQGPRNAGVFKEVLAASDGTESVSDRFTYAVLPVLLPKESATE
jgi:DNA polymerase-3 subunit beta